MNCEQDEYVCSICGATLDSQFKLNMHEDFHDKEAERVVKEINAIDDAMNRAKEEK